MICLQVYQPFLLLFNNLLSNSFDFWYFISRNRISIGSFLLWCPFLCWHFSFIQSLWHLSFKPLLIPIFNTRVYFYCRLFLLALITFYCFLQVYLLPIYCLLNPNLPFSIYVIKMNWLFKHIFYIVSMMLLVEKAGKTMQEEGHFSSLFWYAWLFSIAPASVFVRMHVCGNIQWYIAPSVCLEYIVL